MRTSALGSATRRFFGTSLPPLMGHRAAADVCARMAPPRGSARLPDRGDAWSAWPAASPWCLHVNDIALGDRERAAVLRRLQRALPGRGLSAARLLLLDGRFQVGSASTRRASRSEFGEVAGRCSCSSGSLSSQRASPGGSVSEGGGRDWYERARPSPGRPPDLVWPPLSPSSCFSRMQGDEIASAPLEDCTGGGSTYRPPSRYQWSLGLGPGRVMGFPRGQTPALSFTSHFQRLRTRDLPLPSACSEQLSDQGARRRRSAS